MSTSAVIDFRVAGEEVIDLERTVAPVDAQHKEQLGAVNGVCLIEGQSNGRERRGTPETVSWRMEESF